MIRRPPRSTQGVSSAASDVYKRQHLDNPAAFIDSLLDDAPSDDFDAEFAKLEEELRNGDADKGDSGEGDADSKKE